MEHTSHIIELLKDTSFPQMLLIDGSWGSGKTHYIKNELKHKLVDEFTTHKVHYFSLYGVSSIDDFRDRLISLVLTNNTETSKLTKVATQFADSIATNMGERGIGGILNGAAGAYKYKLYSELDNCILILDDLERISNKTIIKDVLGECLNLAESKNVKVVVVANESKLECPSDIEKVFIDKIKFSYTPNQIATILRDEFSDLLTDPLYKELVSHINNTNSSNVRVLKRALIKFKRLKEEISGKPYISLEMALIKTLRQVLKVCYARFELDYKTNEIVESVESYFCRAMSEEEVNDRDNKLYEILGNELTHKNLVDFCCDGIFKFEDILGELQIPRNKTCADKIISGGTGFYELTEEEFNTGVSELRVIIDGSDNLIINNWFQVCDIFIYLIENRYITSDLTKQKIIEMCTNKNVLSFNLEDIPINTSWINYGDDELNSIYKAKVIEVNDYIELSKNKSFAQDFSVSFSKLEEQLKESSVQDFFLKDIGLEDFIKAVGSWSCTDIYNYTRFAKGQYKFINNKDCLESEQVVIGAAIGELEKLKIDTGLRLGVIQVLIKVLSEINSRMIEKLALDK